MEKINELKLAVGKFYTTPAKDLSEVIEDVESIIDELETEYKELDEKKDELEDQIEALEERPELEDAIDTGRASISFKADNLLDTQIMEAFRDVMENTKVNHVKFLQHLESIAKTGRWFSEMEPIVKRKQAA